MEKIQLFLLTLVLVLMSSCDYVLDINRDGDTISKDYGFTSFSKLLIKGPYKVILTQDTLYKVEVEGLDYLLEDVDITQESSTLIINHNSPSSISESKLPTVYVTCPNYSNVTIDAIGKLYTDTIIQTSFSLILLSQAKYNIVELNINTDNLYLGDYYFDNIGTITFSGSAASANFVVSGSTVLNAQNFRTKNMTLAQMSHYDCTVNVQEVLNLVIYSSGNTYLYGSPEVSVETGSSNVLDASGELIYMEEE